MTGRADSVGAIVRAGPVVAAGRLAGKVASNRRSFGLRCDLCALGATTPADVPVSMVACRAGAFDGFRDALATARGGDYLDVRVRQGLCDLGIETLHVARSADGAPMFVQWCISREQQRPLSAANPGYFRELASGQVLFEAGYTFPAFRRMGVMTDGLGQVLRFAAEAGAETVFTYVVADNLASLRGCGRAGFALDHVRVDRWRMGVRRSWFEPPGPSDQKAWRAVRAMPPSRSPRAALGVPPLVPVEFHSTRER
jgi:RimJ/RimL family protein N-acetyltransferase